jgi:hypothetical protein
MIWQGLVSIGLLAAVGALGTPQVPDTRVTIRNVLLLVAAVALLLSILVAYGLVHG